MWNKSGFIHGFFLYWLWIACMSDALPTSSRNLDEMKTNATDDDYLAQDQATMDCMMEIIEAIASGSDESLSEICENMLATLQNRPIEKPDKSAMVSKRKNADFQSELQDLTSQLRSINADYGISEDSLEDTKRSDLNEGEEEASKETKLSDSETENVKPFVTSMKNVDDDFLVIPLTFLKSELDAQDSMDSMIPDDISPIKSIPKQTTVQQQARDESETMRADDVERSYWVKGEAEEKMNPRQVSVLNRVELDIQRLGEDLQQLEEENIDL